MSFWIRLYRFILPPLVIAAVAAHYHETVVVKHGSAANFFSYFTIHSNLLAAALWLWGACKPGSTSALRDILRGAATLYLAITGVVYSVLLAEEEARLQLILPWVDIVLHRVTPLVMIIDWLVSPPLRALSRSQALAWMIYPLAFMAYTLVRGPLVGWYPYPFLNPARTGGAVGVAAYCVGIMAVVVFFSWLVVMLGGWRTRRRISDRDLAAAYRRAQELDRDAAGAEIAWERIRAEMDRKDGA